MKKRISAVALSGVLMVGMLFAGCGSSASNGSSSSASSKSASSASSSSTKEASSASSASSSSGSAGEGTHGDASELSVTTDEKISIGYLAQNETDQFCVIMGKAIEEEAAAIGPNITVEKSDAQSIAANQVTQAEDMITRGVDAVIISAVDQDASAPAVDKLAEAGIPTVILNTLVSNYEKGVAYVGVDDREAGKVALDIVVDKIGTEGTINVIEGLLGHPANENRYNGILEEIEENYPDIKIGAAQAADWDRNKAMNVVSDWISGGSEVDAIIALNDEMAISAANAYKSAGMDVPIVGIDALDEALELVKSGAMLGTVFQDGVGQGKTACDVAVMAVLGMDVADNYYIPFEPVTADNADDYMGRLG